MYAVRTTKAPARSTVDSPQQFATPDEARRLAQRLRRLDQSIGYTGFTYQVIDPAEATTRR